LKIAQVVPYCSGAFGGGYEYGLSKALVELGHEVTIFTSDRTPWRYRVGSQEEVEGGGVHIRRFRALVDLKELPFMPSLLRALLREDFDILQTSEFFQLCSLYAASASRVHKTPLVLSHHLYYSPWDILKRLGLGLSKRFYGRFVLDNSRKIIAISRSAESYLKEEMNVEGDKIEIIPIGVDATRFSPRVKPYTPVVNKVGDKKMILFVGRLTKYKGVECLLHAFSRLLKDYKDVVLCIRGSGPEGPQILQLESKLGLKGKVLWPSYIPNRDMPRLYAASKLFVLPSLIEPLGIAALEAMASGRPIIASRVGGLADLVEEDVNGYLVSPGSVEALRGAMLRILGDERLERRLGRGSRRLVEERFSWEVVAERTLSLYENLL
jgi:glycosyltransferase involved in cell wall biosynthesis